MKWQNISVANKNFTDAFTTNGVTERSFVLKPEALSPFAAYMVLKKSFGPPNSKQFDDDKSQWMFALECPTAFFEVYDWKVLSWSIAVYLKKGSSINGKNIAEELLQLIVVQSNKLKSTINAHLKDRDGVVIENPFFTYRETADSILTLIEKLKTPDPYEPYSDPFASDFNDFMRHYDLCRAAFMMYLSSVEGFINLIYELYLKRELREDRIYDRIRREQIDLKVQLAPIYCDCFKKDGLNPDADAFKNFHSLANLRNDFVHANLTKPMMNPIVYEDNYEFVVNVQSDTKIGIPNNFRDFESTHIQAVKELTQDFINYILQTMKPVVRREFLELMNHEYIKVEYKNGQLHI